MFRNSMDLTLRCSDPEMFNYKEQDRPKGMPV
jgi:hypothetical protein